MDNFFFNDLVTIKKLILSYFNQEAKEFNLSSSEIKFIHILSLNEGESQAELAKKLDCDKAHIHRIVLKLLVKKIINITNKKQNKCRNLQISLTDNGKEISQKINKKLEEWKSKITKGISQEDLKTLKRVFNTVSNNLKENN